MNEERLPLLNQPERKKVSAWYAIFTMFLVAVSGGALYAPHIQFYTEIFCNIYYDTSDKIPFEKCVIPPIQKMVSKTQAIIMVLTYGSTLIVAGFYGRLSDRKGRRFVIRVSTLGSLIHVICDLITAKYYKSIGISLLLIGPFIRGTMAGESVLMASVQAYIADTTQPSSRTLVFSRLMATLFIGSAIGPFISSFIIKHTGSILYIFYTVLAVDILNVIYTLCILPESITPEPQPTPNQSKKGKGWRPRLFSVFDVILRSNRSLRWLALTEFLLTLVKRPPTMLYAMLKFQWTAYEGSLYYTCTSLLKLTMMMVILPCLVRLYRAQPRFDLWMIRLGIGTDAVCLGLAGLVSQAGLFAASGMLQSVSMLAQPSIRGLFTTLVDPGRTGELLGAVAILDSVAMIVSHFGINIIYSMTVNTRPELIFFVCSAIATCSCICAFMIRKSS